MSKTVSARISSNIHEELRNKCNKLGCTINDFIAASIQLGMTGHSEFEFGFDSEDEVSDKAPEKTQSDVSKPLIFKLRG